jgi:hypothetical protein
MAKKNLEGLYGVLKRRRHRYDTDEVAKLISKVDEERVTALAKSLGSYISKNLPTAISKRKGLPDYRTNPYVLLTSANVMGLSDPAAFGSFLFNNKLYAGLETSFGKSIEAAFVGHYPIVADVQGKWVDAPEKLAEFAALEGLSNEEKARKRVGSVWREIDKSCVSGERRFLTSIKSGPNCINDTQVSGMVDAIAKHHKAWLRESKKTYPAVKELDVVIGLTYGTDATTNNKENQILTKLQEHGFKEEDRELKPGILINEEETVRIYRRIGQDFWSFIGNPSDSASASFVFLEVLLALSKALSTGIKDASLGDRVNLKLLQLSDALRSMMFPRSNLPKWIEEDFGETELFWLATALTAFYDEGI